MSAILETISFGGGLMAPIALYGIAVTLLTSPFYVLRWIVDSLLGRHNELLADQSEQARFAKAVHLVTTTIDALLVAWWMGVF